LLPRLALDIGTGKPPDLAHLFRSAAEIVRSKSVSVAASI